MSTSMPLSNARLRANRRNAQRSTGPKTEEGKQKSRANAYKHGLASDGVVIGPDEAKAAQQRADAWKPQFPVQNDHQVWAYEQMVLATVRIDRCQEHQRRQRKYEAERASWCWDLDRTAEAEDLGRKLSRNPARTVSQLKRFKHGQQWLLERWKTVHEWLDQDGPERPEFRQWFCDLIGGDPISRADDETYLQTLSIDELRTIIETEIAELEERLNGPSEELDQIEFELAATGMPAIASTEGKRLQRYESNLWRQFHWARKTVESEKTKSKGSEPAAEVPERPAFKSRRSLNVILDTEHLIAAHTPSAPGSQAEPDPAASPSESTEPVPAPEPKPEPKKEPQPSESKPTSPLPISPETIRSALADVRMFPSSSEPQTRFNDGSHFRVDPGEVFRPRKRRRKS